MPLAVARPAWESPLPIKISRHLRKRTQLLFLPKTVKKRTKKTLRLFFGGRGGNMVCFLLRVSSFVIDFRLVVFTICSPVVCLPFSASWPSWHCSLFLTLLWSFLVSINTAVMYHVSNVRLDRTISLRTWECAHSTPMLTPPKRPHNCSGWHLASYVGSVFFGKKSGVILEIGGRILVTMSRT